MMEKEDLKQIKELIDTSLDAKLAPIKEQLEVLEPMKLRLSDIESQLESLELMKSRLSGIESQLESLDPIKRQLDSIEIEIKVIRMDLDKLTKTEDEDVVAAYKDIETLRRRVDNLETKLNRMQSARA